MVFLSIIVLKAKYKPVHFFGVSVCLAGLGLMVWADFTSRSQGPKPGRENLEVQSVMTKPKRIEIQKRSHNFWSGGGGQKPRWGQALFIFIE